MKKPQGQQKLQTLTVESSGEDRTPIELFIAGVRGWDAGLQSFLDASTDWK